MSTTLYTSLVWAALLPGLVAAWTYLAIHRPRQIWRAATINADGWVVITALWYTRSVLVLSLRGTTYHAAVDALISIGLLAVIDAMVVYRVVSFLRFRRTFRQASEETK